MRLQMLTQRPDFVRVKAGVAWGTKGFLLQAIAQEPTDQPPELPRFGITVSNHTVRRYLAQKQAKSGDKSQKRGPVSVLRNRMRRRLRALLEQIAPEHAKRGIDYVIIGRPALETLAFEILQKDLQESFQKVHRRIISTNKYLSKS